MSGPQFDFRVTGVVNVQKDLEHAAKVCKDPRAALRRGALVLEGEAKLRVPVDTGFLKNSAFVNDVLGQTPAVIVGFGAEYAAAVEFGTEDGSRPGVFFLRGALDAKRADVHAAIRHAVLGEID